MFPLSWMRKELAKCLLLGRELLAMSLLWLVREGSAKCLFYSVREWRAMSLPWLVREGSANCLLCGRVRPFLLTVRLTRLYFALVTTHSPSDTFCGLYTCWRS